MQPRQENMTVVRVVSQFYPSRFSSLSCFILSCLLMMKNIDVTLISDLRIQSGVICGSHETGSPQLPNTDHKNVKWRKLVRRKPSFIITPLSFVHSAFTVLSVYLVCLSRELVRSCWAATLQCFTGFTSLSPIQLQLEAQHA